MAGLALLAGLLAGLEFTQILKVGVQGLFPALLGLGVGGQLVALQRLRSQGQGLKITHRGLSLLPEQETVPLMPLAALSHLALAQEQTGRLSTQPVLVFCPKDRQAALQWGGGLPEADLNWAKADLEDWLNQL